MIDHEAFIDGYTECALWADCMPYPGARVEELAHEIAEARRLGRDPQRQLCELASIEEEASNSEVGGGEHLELRPGAREKMAVDCLDFIAANEADLIAYCEQRIGQMRARSVTPAVVIAGKIESYAGHDFWLTRNGHGTGFWDRGLGELGERLSDAAKVYGPADDHRPYDCGDGTADA